MIHNATELILIMSKDHKITSGDVENRTLVLPGLNEHAALSFPRSPSEAASYFMLSRRAAGCAFSFNAVLSKSWF